MSSTKKNKTTKRNSPTPQDFIAAGDMQIEEVQQYRWSSYGPYAFFVDIVMPLELGSAQMVVDIAHNRICEMTVCDYTQPKNKQAYLWRNPLFRKAHDAEARQRGYTKKQMSYAWDKTPWVNVTPAQIFKRLRELVARAKRCRMRGTKRRGST